MKKNNLSNPRTIVFIAMFSALASVLESLQFPVPFAPPFYNLDFAETPILIGAFALGPVPAVFMELIKNLFKLIIRGTSTFYVGELGNFIGGCAFVLPASIIYQRHKTKKTAIIGLIVSVITAVAVAVAVNCLLTIPLYAKLMFDGIDAIISMGTAINPMITNLYTFAIFAIVPFNIFKCTLNAFMVLILYKRVSLLIRRIPGDN